MKWKAYHKGVPIPPPKTPEQMGVRAIEKYVRFLQADRITLDEFRYNAMLIFVSMPESGWWAAADTLPPEIAADFCTYIDAYLSPLDCMPAPHVFMADTRSEEAIEQMRRELRPKYVALHRFWREQANKGS